jgi:hypothetical protein
MSRAIGKHQRNAKANSSSHSAAHNIINVFVTAGDNYLKPYVSCEPEVSVTDRTAEDDCLILASDGLWDVVSNETACGVARMCLRGKAHAPPRSPMEDEAAASDTSEGTLNQTPSFFVVFFFLNVYFLVFFLRGVVRIEEETRVGECFVGRELK